MQDVVGNNLLMQMVMYVVDRQCRLLHYEACVDRVDKSLAFVVQADLVLCFV